MRWTIATALIIAGTCVFGCCPKPPPDATPDEAEHASAAGALATADARTGPLSRVLSGIDQAIAVCEDNIAHADTTAFRATAAAISADGAARLVRDSSQGALTETRRALDVAIQGRGFFRVRVPGRDGSGFAYTRNGNFFIDDKGGLTLGVGDGCPLMPPIKLPADSSDITITESGVVRFKQPGSTSESDAGQVLLWRFRDEASLRTIGQTLFAETNASGPAIESGPGSDGAGILVQGFLEASNVDLARERIRLRFLDNWRRTLLRTADAE